ncbi:arginine--tRNA ligase [Candidatus Woesearchaeota archaeon]|nr:arginine--tRNA ligase [Candidatus Woesearchaeota archaeon]
MDKFKEHIIKILKKHVKIDFELEVPPSSDMGDYAFPCFPLAKTLKKSPNEISKDLSKKIKNDKIISEVKTLGPYLNFFVNKSSLAESTLNKVLKEKEQYGSSNLGKNKKIILEHTSINPNASPHVGRARNAMIGDAIARILRFQNYDVEVRYYVNDIGKQIAMLVLGARKTKKLDFDSLLSVYQKISKEVENSKNKEQEIFNLLKELESGNKEIKEEFKKVVAIALKGQEKLFSDLGIEYDVFDHESSYLWSKKTKEVLEMLQKTGKFFFDKDNRFILDQRGFGLGMKMPVFVLTRGDGTSLYSLRDIAYALDMEQKAENIVVLGEDQKLYNEQINAALLTLERNPRKAVHYSFVLLEDGKMSTRKGNLVLLEDFMEESVKKAEAELKNRHDQVDHKAAKVIGYGALKFSILKVSPEKNVVFNWEHALSFEGETSPYIQYAYARINSILKKTKLPKKADLSLLTEKEEAELVKKIAYFPEIAEKAARELRPSTIASYSYDLAKSFNEYYHKHQILKAEKETMEARLVLIKCVQQTIKNSLDLLGIDVLERM